MIKKIIFLVLAVGLFAYVGWHFFGSASTGGSVRITLQDSRDMSAVTVDARATVIVGSSNDIKVWKSASRAVLGDQGYPDVVILLDNKKPNAVEVIESELGSWSAPITQSENIVCLVNSSNQTNTTDIAEISYYVRDCRTMRPIAMHIPADISLMAMGANIIDCEVGWHCSEYKL